MAIGFFKRIKIAHGISMNMSKSGFSLTCQGFVGHFDVNIRNTEVFPSSAYLLFHIRMVIVIV